MKPIVVGMCDPYSDDPAHALWPDPPGCAGWRLWKMVNDVSGMSQDEYVAAFDLRNLVIGQSWNVVKARASAKRFVAMVSGGKPGQSIVILGRGPADALGFKNAVVGRPIRAYGAEWFVVPHPSGRCLYYNDAMNRWRTGELLVSLHRRGLLCAA